ITAADTADEVQGRAISVLDFHVEGMVEDGEPLPVATSLDEILEDPENRDGLVMAVQVPLADKKKKKVRVDLTIPGDVLRQVDRFVKKTEGINRSSFFSGAVLERLQRVSPHQPARAARLKGGKTTRIKSRKRTT
ncbi:MAG: type II toxin-antitoxin system HicB family antitoxin, partial [Nitrospinae bacterium]|nr:type II toxin-antitoxin system HicB family antitoxin [Nitrospinota bacterium]